jgi:hypothetical protein
MFMVISGIKIVVSDGSSIEGETIEENVFMYGVRCKIEHTLSTTIEENVFVY